MKQVQGYIFKKFTYETREEREKHIKEMNKKGYHESGRVREFTGDLLIDDTSDESNYIYIAEFYKYV